MSADATLSIAIILFVITGFAAVIGTLSYLGMRSEYNKALNKMFQLRDRLSRTETLLYDLMDPVEANNMIEQEIEESRKRLAFERHQSFGYY